MNVIQYASMLKAIEGLENDVTKLTEEANEHRKNMQYLKIGISILLSEFQDAENDTTK